MKRRSQKKLKVVVSGGNELWLPSSLLADILSRLPCEALVRLRSVSMEWNSVVSDRTFARIQMKPHGERLSGFFFQGSSLSPDEDIKSVSYLPLLPRNGGEEVARVESGVLGFLPEQVVVLSSVNGLLCCRSCFPSPNPLMVYVCNPINREWTALPWPHPHKDYTSTALAFSPFGGLPHDIPTDFQVVTVCQTAMGEEEEEDEEVLYQFKFKIYSSRAREWRESREVFTSAHKLQRKGCVLAEDGTVYWLTEDNHVLMFNLANELCCLIHGPYPASGLDFVPEVCLGEVQGRVQYVLFSHDGLQVWELKGPFVPEWGLKRFLSPEDLDRENPECMPLLSKKLESDLPTELWPLFVDLLSFKDTTLLLRIATGIYAFDIDTGKARWIRDISLSEPTSWVSPIVIPYTMSLAPIA